MMKYTPRVRSETAPTISAAAPEASTAAGQPNQALVRPSAIAMLAT